MRTGYIGNLNGFSALRVGIWGLEGKIHAPEMATVSSKPFLKVTVEKHASMGSPCALLPYFAKCLSKIM